jgi:hypothetical protein
MNNRNQQTVRSTAPADEPARTYLNVFTVEEYESNGKTAKKWTKIGAAFPHKDGLGFGIELRDISDRRSRGSSTARYGRRQQPQRQIGLGDLQISRALRGPAFLLPEPTHRRS